MVCIVISVFTRIYPAVFPWARICQKNVSVLIVTLSRNRRIFCTIQRISGRIKICDHIYSFSVCRHCRINKCCRIVIPCIPVISEIICKSIMPCFSFVCWPGHDRIQTTAVSARIPSGVTPCHYCAVIKRHKTRNSKLRASACSA